MAYGSPQDGGYLVPDETEAEIGRRLAVLSPIRGIAAVRKVSGAVLKKPFATNGPAVGWIGETAARPETATASLAELQFPTMEIYAMPAATATLLEDSVVDIEQWIADEVETAFAEQEGAAFVRGDGSNRPRGFLDHEAVAEADWQWGKLGALNTGVAGALPESEPVGRPDRPRLYAEGRLPPERPLGDEPQGPGVIRKLKDADGNYLCGAAGSRRAAGDAARLSARRGRGDAGHRRRPPTPIAFGDFRRGYLVVDRSGVRVLRETTS